MTDNATPTTNAWQGESAVPGLHEKPPMTNATPTTEAEGYVECADLDAEMAEEAMPAMFEVLPEYDTTEARDEGLVRLRGELDVVLFSLRNGPHLLTLSAVRDAVDPFLARLSAAEAELREAHAETDAKSDLGHAMADAWMERALAAEARADAAMAVGEDMVEALGDKHAGFTAAARTGNHLSLVPKRVAAIAAALARFDAVVRKEGA